MCELKKTVMDSCVGVSQFMQHLNVLGSTACLGLKIIRMDGMFVRTYRVFIIRSYSVFVSCAKGPS